MLASTRLSQGQRVLAVAEGRGVSKGSVQVSTVTPYTYLFSVAPNVYLVLQPLVYIHKAGAP